MKAFKGLWTAMLIAGLFFIVLAYYISFKQDFHGHFAVNKSPKTPWIVSSHEYLLKVPSGQDDSITTSDVPQFNVSSQGTMVNHFNFNLSMRGNVYTSSEHRIRVYGKLQAGANYSVLSSTTQSHESLKYLYDLPLTVLAWRRVGFSSIVILIVESLEVTRDVKLNFVISTLRQLQCIVVLLESHRQYVVMMSQVSRLFVSHFFDFHSIDNIASWQETYIVTSDADLWPLMKNVYNLPPDKQILSLNSYCCGTFVHKGRSYLMLPIGNIGMKVQTWLSISRRHGYVPSDTGSIVRFLIREFGAQVTDSVQKGENAGWYMDQRIISILIQDWSLQNNSSGVLYVPRNTGKDRIDKDSNRNPVSIEGKVDCHISDSAFESHNTNRLSALLVLMYDKNIFSWFETYTHMFHHIFKLSQK